MNGSQETLTFIQIVSFLEQAKWCAGDEEASVGMIQTFKEFQARFAAIDLLLLDQSRSTAPRYNIFTIIDKAHLEAQTHSRFLSHLLDPVETHGQGYLFLESFLTYCAKHLSGFPDLAGIVKTEGWMVVREDWAKDCGQMDIALKHPALGFHCVIENKIFAGEQADQLSRYASEMEKSDDFSRQALVFLTIDGHESKTAGNFPYFRMSYRKDVVAWLSDARDRIQAPAVSEVVRQYVSLWKNWK